MKKSDEIIITADEKDLSYIHSYNRTEILSNPTGIIYHVYKDGCDVRTVSGIWYIDKKHLKLKGVE